MDDSFFGFDSSIPLDEDGSGRIAEPSEEEYDALNDETFGSATNGDWEEAHESLVRLKNHFTNDSVDSSGPGECELHPNDRCISSRTSSGVSTPAHMNTACIRQIGTIADSDLELNLSNMKMDDVIICYDDNESVLSHGGISNISMDPSVWSLQPCPKTSMKPSSGGVFSAAYELDGYRNISTDLPHPQFPSHFHQIFHHNLPKQQLHDAGGASLSAFGLPHLPIPGSGPKICTLEDIERNLILQQTMQKQQQHHMQVEPQLCETLSQLAPDQAQQSPQHHGQKPCLPIGKGVLPSFGSIQTHLTQRPTINLGNNIGTLRPMSNIHQQQPVVSNRMPVGYSLLPHGMPSHVMAQQGVHPSVPAHPMLSQHGLPGNFQHTHRSLANPHLPIALNNFAMHPNFNAMRAAAVAAGFHASTLLPPQPTGPRITNANPVSNHQTPVSSNSIYNVFNMRLVQEIQQNHPLLQNNARQHHQQQMNAGIVGHNYATFNQQLQPRGNGALKPNYRREGGIANGNLPSEAYDAYSNLMSTRDKHWLIGIQLSQLNTDTPYIDDYYYTVYRERKALLNGNVRHSQAHKDNQLNHPLTQLKGHAQLIMVQLGNKNGTRNGQNRERHNSESVSGVGNSGEQKTPYIFTPMKFENSLGKLQYGSVTAPRKIIDADIMGVDNCSTAAPDAISGQNITTTACTATNSGVGISTGMIIPTTGVNGDGTINTQRKSRHILLHIETLYRFVLKLEDLDNPNAIATIIMKKKKETERISALELLENATKTPEDRDNDAASTNPMMKPKFAYEIEPKKALVDKLIAGLTYDKTVAMMNVRKGKALIKRLMPYIESNDIRWNVWICIFTSLQYIMKKDPEDADGMLYAFYLDFTKQIKSAPFEKIVQIAQSIPLSENKSSSVFCSRFGISSLVCLILQAEHIFVTESNPISDHEIQKPQWRHFLKRVASALNFTIQTQTICATIESDSIQPLMNHFERFKDLKLDSLLALVTEANQQIN